MFQLVATCHLICFKTTAVSAKSWRKNSLKISSSIIHCKCDATNLLFHTNLMLVHSYSSQNSEAVKLHKSMRFIRCSWNCGYGWQSVWLLLVLWNNSLNHESTYPRNMQVQILCHSGQIFELHEVPQWRDRTVTWPNGRAAQLCRSRSSCPL